MPKRWLGAQGDQPTLDGGPVTAPERGPAPARAVSYVAISATMDADGRVTVRGIRMAPSDSHVRAFHLGVEDGEGGELDRLSRAIAAAARWTRDGVSHEGALPW